MQMAYIGMGGNLPSWAGAPEATLAAAAQRLESLGHVAARSSLYSTEPVGFTEQPRFVNAVLALETKLEPQQLLEGLLALELEFGRNRLSGFTNGPRTLDLDILLFGDRTVNEPDLQIPHPRLVQRAFVLIPLAEIAPDIVVPGSGETAARLVASHVSKARHGVRGPKGGSSADSDTVVRLQSDRWSTG
jgi:2-amino-4-hydroxy-6-hydroxymethyldihydropteridine diphosphokinase